MIRVLPREVASARRRMARLAVAYRRRHPLPEPPRASGSFPIACNIAGQPSIKTLAWFPSVGCWWSRAGGCTFCDFGMMADPGTLDEVVASWRAHLDELDRGLLHLHIAPGGSFFSDRELDGPTRRAVVRATHVFPFLLSLGFETRPDELTVDGLLEVISAVGPTVRDVYVGFGLESSDDFVREVIVNKGYGLEAVLGARDVIDEVNAAQDAVTVHFETYTMIKPLFVTEGEAIDDAVRTAAWSYDQGAETVVLFLNTTKEATLQSVASTTPDLGWPAAFRPPYYRSAVEVLRRMPEAHRRRTVVLGLQSGVLAAGMPRGCPLCSPMLTGALMAHNFTREGALLEHAARSHCPCRADWRAEVERLAPTDLATRTSAALDLLEPLVLADAKGADGG